MLSKRQRRLIRWSKTPNAAWYAAHADRIIHKNPIKRAPIYRLMRVTTEYFTAGVIWQTNSGIWSIARVAPILQWMAPMTIQQAHLALIKLDAKYEWIGPASTVLSELVSSKEATGLLSIRPAVRPITVGSRLNDAGNDSEPAPPHIGTTSAQGAAPSSPIQVAA